MCKGVEKRERRERESVYFCGSGRVRYTERESVYLCVLEGKRQRER